MKNFQSSSDKKTKMEVQKLSKVTSKASSNKTLDSGSIQKSLKSKNFIQQSLTFIHLHSIDEEIQHKQSLKQVVSSNVLKKTLNRRNTLASYIKENNGISLDISAANQKLMKTKLQQRVMQASIKLQQLKHNMKKHQNIKNYIMNNGDTRRTSLNNSSLS